MASTYSMAMHNDPARVKERAIYAAIRLLIAAGVPATIAPYYGSMDMNRIIVLPGVVVLDNKDKINGKQKR